MKTEAELHFDKLVEQRRAIGRKTYGKGLTHTDSYDWNQMALEEALDLAQYLAAENLRLRAGAIKGMDDEISWVRIPGGGVITDDNRAIHVTHSFEMARTPVTQAQWRAVMGTNPSRWKSDYSDYLPVESVTWHDAVAFCEKIDARLPDELEWEYACRAGTSGDRYGELDEIAWYYDNSDEQPHPVANKKPNAFGLYDMLGLVWEWTRTQDGSVRVIRGGSRGTNADVVRAGVRSGYIPGYSFNFLGFRPVRDCRGAR